MEWKMIISEDKGSNWCRTSTQKS